MLLTFLVTVEDKHVRKLEQEDDTVFHARLQSIILKELQGFSEVKRNEVHVMEVTGMNKDKK